MFRTILTSTLLASSAFAASIRRAEDLWQPAVGSRMQMIISGNKIDLDTTLVPTSATIWDIDLFENDATMISTLQGRGKKVVCYFSQLSNRNKNFRNTDQDYRCWNFRGLATRLFLVPKR